ncbi:hypothetical protein FRX31_013673 [Thalictrum thalictroides]|uniref:RNase H type-1 domain-containing protein n=1 Tax=Thalictrum thalictroides TaxID=46969 RepID=A0A7J6WJC4_THATH|nr:hypothetical protein FRX31_013673 [Thalictrum thalictroides]
MISAGCCSGSTGSSEQAKCSGILSATRWALSQGVRRMELETDCRAAAQFLNGQSSTIVWLSTSLLNEASDLFTKFEFVLVKFCNRTCNHDAHLIAQQADVANYIPVVFNSAPEFLSIQLDKDSLLCNISDL